MLLLPDAALSPVTPKESDRERERERIVYVARTSGRQEIFARVSSVLLSGQMCELGEPRGQQPPRRSGEGWGL